MRRFGVDELVRLPSFYGVTLNHARNAVAYYTDRTGHIEIETLSLAQGAHANQVSRGSAPRSPRTAIVWSRDDDALFYGLDADGDEQHQVMKQDLAERPARPLTDRAGQHYPGLVSPVHGEMLVTSNRDGQLNVYVLDLETESLRPLTRFAQPAHAVGWSADGEWVFFDSNEEDDRRNSDVYRIRRDGTGQERVWSTGVGAEDSSRKVSPDGRWLALMSNASGPRQPAVMELATREVRSFGDGATETVPQDFSPDSSKLLVMELKDSQSYLAEIDLVGGAQHRLPAPVGMVVGAAYLADGRVLLQHGDTRHRPRLLALDGATGETTVVLDAEYGAFAPDDFAEGEYVSFPSGGLTIHGILYKPSAGDGRMPAVVLVHGGPTGQDFLSFNPQVQFFCSRGFAVLQVNFRGSTGYGKAFQEMNIGDIGGGDADDVAAGARFLAADPDIDASRLVCVGGSYGGYMTYRQLTHFPELWAGGVATVGITDWAQLYADSMGHFKSYLELLFQGTPQTAGEAYRKASPIHEVERMMAPILMMQAANDPRCPANQARSFRDRLMALGKKEKEDFDYIEFDDQGHGSLDTDQRVRSFRLMDGFLERFAPAPDGTKAAH